MQEVSAQDSNSTGTEKRNYKERRGPHSKGNSRMKDKVTEGGGGLNHLYI